jgi:predicted glutamine amidotransferase
VAYQGHPVLIADLLYRPRHSLVQQSQHSELLSQTFNADGFGVGFFTPNDPTPCVVRSTAPAWSNRSMESLSRRLYSKCIFAHVRAASPGLPVQITNCHPFGHGRFLFMHNGTVERFRFIKRRLQNVLSDAAWEMIEGGTDSEHAFALLLDSIGTPDAEPSTAELRAALVATIRRLIGLACDAGVSDAMTCNFAVTDGVSTVVSRFAHHAAREAASLYWSAGGRYVCEGEDGDMLPSEGGLAEAVIVASEPLTRRTEDWTLLPENHTIAIAPDRSVTLEAIEI